MTENQKTVFISYRRNISKYIARLIFDMLQSRGYDVFIDIESIDSGKFNKIILNQIAARAHFIIILSPRSLDRSNDPNDWLRKEIEYAIKLDRNIVPIMVEGFDFYDIEENLPHSLLPLLSYNGLPLNYEYLDESIERLCTRFLKKPVYGAIVPTPLEDRDLVAEKIQKAKEGKRNTQPNPFESEKTSDKEWKDLFTWGLMIGVIIPLMFVFLLLFFPSKFRPMILDVFINAFSGTPTATCTATSTISPSSTKIPTETSTLTPTTVPTVTETQKPSVTPLPQSPVIDAIELPSSIICDGRRYVFPIKFHDVNGDADFIEWELIYSKKKTPLTSMPRKFEISSSSQINGAIFEDWLEWYISGDEVVIRVTITDKTGLSGTKDFEFVCSP